MSEIIPDSDGTAAPQGSEPATERPTRGTAVGGLTNDELSRMVDIVTARDREFFRIRRRRNFRVRKASVFEVEHFGRHSSLNYDELPPGYSWFIVVYCIHEKLRMRVPFIAQHRKIIEASDDEARAIYELVCGERWKELAEQVQQVK